MTLDEISQYAKDPGKSLPYGSKFSQEYPVEHAWIQSSTFDFAAKMRVALDCHGSLTPGQLAAVQRCVQYKAPQHTPAPQGGLDISGLPEGHYAVPGGDTRLKVRIQRGAGGKWGGFTFVTDGAEYGRTQRYGMQAPGKPYRGQISEQLAIIAQDPRAASVAYGKLVGRCGICNRRLEDADSVARGIGPICAEKAGW